MNLSHGLSNLQLLVKRERTLVFGTRYSSIFKFEPDVKIFFFRAGDFKFGLGLCIELLCRHCLTLQAAFYSLLLKITVDIPQKYFY